MRGVINFVLFLYLLGATVIADISQTTITTGPYLTYGSGLVASGYIRITPAAENSGGIILYSTQQTVGYGFTTEFTYTSTNCYGGGGDG